MPFKKTGKNRNVSPSGRVFTDRQVRAYYATDGFARSPDSGGKPPGGIRTTTKEKRGKK